MKEKICNIVCGLGFMTAIIGVGGVAGAIEFGTWWLQSLTCIFIGSVTAYTAYTLGEVYREDNIDDLL